MTRDWFALLCLPNRDTPLSVAAVRPSTSVLDLKLLKWEAGEH
jgi:hypothetical protein